MDKSWVHAPGKLIHSVAQEFHMLFSEVLFYELLTTAPSEMTHCFRNLIGLEASLALIPNLRRLLRYENNTQEPCTPLLKRKFVVPIEINRKTGQPNFPFSDKQRALIESERSRRDVEDPKEIQEVLASTAGWFPALKKVKPGSNRQLIDKLEEHIASDDQMIKAIYNAIRHPPMPPASSLSQDWAYYRRMQVYLLAGVDYCWRYGSGNKECRPKDFANQCIDLEYLVLGLLADAFLTRENRLRHWHRLLKPSGRLLPSEEGPANPAGGS
jgi:hypothetical protein